MFVIRMTVGAAEYEAKPFYWLVSVQPCNSIVFRMFHYISQPVFRQDAFIAPIGVVAPTGGRAERQVEQ